MGTNYYLKSEVCPHCGVAKSERHIGKSSAGWCFGLHIYPDAGINDLSDWKQLFTESNTQIQDEYKRLVHPSEMLAIIENRGRKESWETKPMFYESWEEFHRRNYSERGPSGLLRHQVGQYCAKHGEGTWDCIEGDFS